MAPEMWNGDQYDFKADVWSLGVILYEMITLKKPFYSEFVKELLELIKYHPIEPFG